MFNMNTVAIWTLIYKELKRGLRVPLQVFGAPIITTLLYFLVFGFAIGERIGVIHNLQYTEFIMPGLIMMNILTTSFFSVSSGILLQKFMNTFTDLLVSPMSYLEIVIGYTLSAVIRSLMVGILIYLSALFFIPFTIVNPIFLILFTLMVTAAFSLFGLMAGLWATTFEQVSVVPTFIITPLTFLGGIFYSIEMLPALAQTLSKFNPFFYMINGMRYGFYGVTDIAPLVAFLFVLVLLILLGIISWNMFRTGYKLKE